LVVLLGLGEFGSGCPWLRDGVPPLAEGTPPLDGGANLADSKVPLLAAAVGGAGNSSLGEGLGTAGLEAWRTLAVGLATDKGLLLGGIFPGGPSRVLAPTLLSTWSTCSTCTPLTIHCSSAGTLLGSANSAVVTRSPGSGPPWRH